MTDTITLYIDKYIVLYLSYKIHQTAAAGHFRFTFLDTEIELWIFASQLTNNENLISYYYYISNICKGFLSINGA